jgi:hypothetical protein
VSLKNASQRKAGGVAQDVCPEFKPQCQEKKVSLIFLKISTGLFELTTQYHKMSGILGSSFLHSVFK